jgi:hypothetical protein
MSLELWKRLVSRSLLLTTLHITEQKNLLELLGVLVESSPHRIQSMVVINLRVTKGTRYIYSRKYD